MRRFILFLIILSPLIGKSQVSSVASGDWADPGTWTCNCVPNFNDGLIRIEPSHTVTITTTIQADELIISADGILIIASGGRLIVNNGIGDDLTQESSDPPNSLLDGQIIINASGVLENRGQISFLMTSMIFESGSEYQHNQNGNAIPDAIWLTGSTCRITGWTNTSTGTAMSSFRSSLTQNFHHFIWDNPGQTIANVQFLGSLITVNGNLIFNQTSSNGNGVSLGLNSNTSGSITIGGDFIVNSNARVNMSVAGTYTVNIGGNCTFSSALGTAPQYQIVSSSGTTNFNVAGDFTLNSGQVNLSTATGTGNINIGGNLNLNGGVIAKPGTGTGNVTFTGAVNHTITKVSGTFSGGNLTVQSGTLNVSGNPLSLAGDISIASGATFNLPATISTAGNINFVSGSTINSNNGIVTLTGSVPQSINANGATLNNLALNKGIGGITVSVASPLSLTGELTISSSVIGTIFNAGTFPNNLTLISTSDSTTGNARIGSLTNGANVIGSVTVQRFMSPEDRIYRYISSPVTNAAASQLQDDFPITGTFMGNNNGCTGCSSNASMFLYNASTAQYSQFPVSANTEVLTPGRGYAAYIRQNILPGAVTIDLTGPINQGPVSLPVFHNAVPDSSWNLVGNPYPSSIDWDEPTGWTKTNIGGSIAVRDAGLGKFQYWNGTTGGLTNGIIATGQGFWVWTIASSPVLTIQETAKASSTGAFLRKEGNDVVTIKLSKGNLSDETYFQFLEEASLGFDHYDAPKLRNDEFDFSTRFANTSQLAINAVNNLPCGSELFLDLRFTKDSSGAFVINPEGSYNVAFEITGSEFDKYEIMLIDQFTGAELVVSPGFKYDFSITSDPASLVSDRLKLRFEGILPSLNLELVGADVVCGSKETTLVVKNTDKRFEYFLSNGEEVISNEKSGTGGDLSFAVPGSLLLPGSNQLNVGVKGVCGLEFLTNKWEVTHYQDASISVKEGDILVSNYTTGNQWYFNDEAIPGANDQILKIEKSGIYAVEVNTGTCTSRSTITYSVTGLESGQIAVSVYPNPFKDKIYLTSNDLFNPGTKISILNNLGQQVCDQTGLSRERKDAGSFSLGNLSDGIYFIRINLPTGVGVYKILKYTP